MGSKFIRIFYKINEQIYTENKRFELKEELNDLLSKNKKS